MFKGRELLDGEALAVLELQDFDSVALAVSENPYIAVDDEGATTMTSKAPAVTVTPSVAKAPANTQSLLSQLQQEQRAQCRMQVMFKAALSSVHDEMKVFQAKLKEQQENTAELKKQAVEQQEKYAKLKTQADEQLQENAEQKVLILQLQHQMKDIKAIVASSAANAASKAVNAEIGAVKEITDKVEFEEPVPAIQDVVPESVENDGGER